MKGIRGLLGVLVAVVLPIVGIACGQVDESQPAIQIGAEAQDLATQARANTPITVAGRIVEFDIPPQSNGQPRVPVEIVVGPDNHLWFRASPQIGRMSMDGRHFRFFDAPPAVNGFGGFGIAVGSDGNIWFPTGLGIARMHLSGAFEEFPLPNLLDGQAIVAGHDGNLWVLGIYNVYRVTTAGVVTTIPLPVPVDGTGNHIANGPDGNVWFTAGGAYGALVGRVTPAGVITEFSAGQMGGLLGIATGHDGYIWLTRQGNGPGENAIDRMTTGGAVSILVQLPDSTTPAPQVPTGSPMVITAGEGDAMYYTTYLDQPLNHIGRVTSEGRVTEFTIPTPGAASFGITVDRDGDVWFTEEFNSKIGRLRPYDEHRRFGFAP